MIIIVLLGALVFYTVLYLLWESSRGNMDSLSGILAAVERMFFAPENLIFIIFRGLILVTVLYVVLDFLRSLKYNIQHRRQLKAEKNAKMELKYKDPAGEG